MMSSKSPLFKIWLMETAVLFLLTAIVFLHPAFFPMHGFSGPASWREQTLQGIRFTGDSWRYIEGGQKLLERSPLDHTQKSYRGYILLSACSQKIAASMWPLVLFQVLLASVALHAILNMGYGIHPSREGAILSALLCGILFACNPEFAAWHTAIMTESAYVSAVCILTWLSVWAVTSGPAVIKILPVLLFAVMVAFIRPTGWILLPAIGIFWSCALVTVPWKRYAIILLIMTLFLCCAFLGSSFHDGIQQESPSVKLYTGEVVWREDLWRVKMPPADLTQTALSEGFRYGLRHPLASAKLVFMRILIMFLRIRPGYSCLHNAFLLCYHVPLTLLAFWGIWKRRNNRYAQAAGTFIIAHALVVALTFNDNDGRFTLYFTPLLGILAISALLSLLPEKWQTFMGCRQRPPLSTP